MREVGVPAADIFAEDGPQTPSVGDMRAAGYSIRDLLYARPASTTTWLTMWHQTVVDPRMYRPKSSPKYPPKSSPKSSAQIFAQLFAQIFTQIFGRNLRRNLRPKSSPKSSAQRRAPAPPPPTAPTPPPTSLRNTDVRRRHRVPSHTCGASFPPTNCGPLRLSQVIQRLRRCREAVSQVGPSRAPWSPECRLRRSTRAGGFPSRASPTSRSSRGDQICRLGCPWVSIWMAPMMTRAESP